MGTGNGQRTQTIHFYRLIKIRDYVRWPIQTMPKRAAQGSLFSVPPVLLQSAGCCGCFLIPGSMPGNASSHDVKKRSLTCPPKWAKVYLSVTGR